MAAAKKAAPVKKAPVKTAAVKSVPPKKTVARKAVSAKAAPTKKPNAVKKANAIKKAAPPKAAVKAGPAKKPAVKAVPTKKAASVNKAPTKAAAKTAAPAKKAPRKPLFDAKWLDAQREALLDERATYERQARNFQAEADELAALREPGDVQFDEESGEGDTLAVERERDLALSAQALAAIEDIDHALAKITAGTYGVCEVSGEPIPKERLEAIPWARERVEYKVGGFGRR